MALRSVHLLFAEDALFVEDVFDDFVLFAGADDVVFDAGLV